MPKVAAMNHITCLATCLAVVLCALAAPRAAGLVLDGVPSEYPGLDLGGVLVTV